MDGPDYYVSPADRVAFIGKTQSGKTHVAGILAAPVERIIVLDAKGKLRDTERRKDGKYSWRLTEWHSKEGAKARKEMEDGGPGRLRCPAPVYGSYEPVIEWAYRLENVLLYADELYGVTEGTRPGRWLRACYTRGAELGIGVWSAFQRPRDIPKIALTEAEWRFMFQLPDPDDRAFMVRQMGGYQPTFEPIRERQFWLFQNGWDKPEFFGQIAPSRRLPV